MTQYSKILIVDDEENGRLTLEIILSKLGYQVTSAVDGEDAIKHINKARFDLVLSDLRMPKLDGLGLLSALRQTGNNIPVIIITSYGSIESAVTAMKGGAFDFITRPFDNEQVELVINRALETDRLQRENKFLRNQLEVNSRGELIGESPNMKLIYTLINRVAPTSANVFITGETGCGKELIAKAIHIQSGRKGLFVAVNCAALPSTLAESELFGHIKGAFTGADKDRIGKFEFAHQGTLFLDEITEMNIDLQAKLLRVLQENSLERLGSNRSIKTDVRIIAASNRDIDAAVADNHLRKDIFYRLNVFNISVPPLRERKDDILLLAESFIEKHKTRMGYMFNIKISAAAIEVLMDYSWPGNVRELENIIERAVILCTDGIIKIEHLACGLKKQIVIPSHQMANNQIQFEDQVANFEKKMIETAIESAGGNKAKAARILNISERTFWNKLKKYNMTGN